MKLLLDTNVFLHLAAEPERISKKVRNSIDDAELVFLSAASAWEIAIKVSIGKLELPAPAGEYTRSRMERLQIGPLEITHAHASAVETLVFHHRDPFDRLIVVQARLEGLLLVTTNNVLARYGPSLISR
ncbi:MAG: type II toxin-antitoxin system VapC family toxin [Candidatus Baltobacteraceae bacterium]